MGKDGYEPRFGDGREEDWFAWLCKQKVEMALWVEKEMAKRQSGAARKKEEKVFHEYGQGKLHSGSKHGPIVKSHKQAIAIAMSEGRKASHGKSHKSKHHR